MSREISLSRKSSIESISEISEHCRWRDYLSLNDKIQAHDGRGWYSASILNVQSKHTKDILVGYDNYSSSYDFWCSRYSKRLRPTIGFLRRKIMLPQVAKIIMLETENKSILNKVDSLQLELNKSKQNNKLLNNNLNKKHEELKKIKKKYNEEEYEYLAVKKMSNNSLKIADDENEMNDIADDLIPDEDEIEDLLMSHCKTLSKWNIITKELEKMKFEVDILIENGFDELENGQNGSLNIKDLARVQTMVNKRFEVQQQRLESVNDNIILPIMNKKFEITSNIQKYQNEISEIKEKNSNILGKYDVLQNDCKQLISSLTDLVNYCNQKVVEENNLSVDKHAVTVQLNEIKNYLLKYTEFDESYFSLLKGFQKFISINRSSIKDTTLKMKLGWNFVEGLWYKWNSHDIISWIRYKMNWMNQHITPNYLDFCLILENMDKKQIKNGKSLINLNKNDLLEIGFKIHSHRNQIYEDIKCLIAKHEIPNEDEHDHDNDNEEKIEKNDTVKQRENEHEEEDDNDNDDDMIEIIETYLNEHTNDDDNDDNDDTDNNDDEDDDSSMISRSEGCIIDDYVIANNLKIDVIKKKNDDNKPNSKYPKKYVCSLTNKLMEDPVVCAHNNQSYEKTVIYEYIYKNGKLPSSNEQPVNIDLKDKCSFLLFDNCSLKVEIEQFKKQNKIKKNYA